MDEKRNVLLKLENVKMHFPLKRIFFDRSKDINVHRERPSVKAVDGVTIDIYEGETFGLVGESGCGKSTLGRVLLQLYNQTAGSIRYSGVTFNDYAPGYAFDDAAKISSIRGSAEEIAKKFPEQARIAGGLLLSDNLPEVTKALIANLAAVSVIYTLQMQINLLELKRVAFVESEGNHDKSLTKIKHKMDRITAELKKAEEKRDKCDARLKELHQPCQSKPGYDLLQAAKDVSVDLSRLSKEEMRRLRRDLQIVFQDPYSSLNQRFSVGQLISEALVAHKMYGRGTKQLEDYILGVMDKCGLQNYFLHRYPHQFSGGQRQRIGIARALAPQPKFIVCDEAVSALDVSIQSQIINLLMDLKDSSNLTYLFISHDLSTVKFISDRVGVMYLGNIIELGKSDEIFKHPMHPYTNVLLKAIPTTDEASKKELQVIEGDIPSPVNPPPGCKFHTRCEFAQDICKCDEPEWRELRPSHWVACHFPVGKET